MAEKNATLTSRHDAYLGLDVGKLSHWAYAVDREGEVLLNRRVDSAEEALDALMVELPADTLVVVDQRRNIGALAIRRARAAGRQQSGSSIKYDKGCRGGNKPLKNLLVFSCNSLIRSKGYYGEYLRRCLARAMKFKCALKATARKRMKVIYAVMRDGVPYAE